MNTTNKKMLVSVIIPAYNRPIELKRSIQSILIQTYDKFEVIVVDDGSDQNLKTICDSFDDHRIRYYKLEKHTNANVARNKGIIEANGEYIAMLDSDDEFLPIHLERRIQKIQEWDCDGIYGSSYLFDGEKKNLRLSRLPYEDEKMINYLLSDGWAPTPSHFYKRSAARDIMWDETLERHQDYDFSVRFYDKYKYYCDYKPTILINWTKNDKRDLKPDSCINFINRHVDSISENIYNTYHRRIFQTIAGYESQYYINYYKKNSYKYIYTISFAEFLLVHNKNIYVLPFVFLKFILLHIPALIKKFLRDPTARPADFF